MTNLLDDLKKITDEMLNNTGLIPHCVNVGDVTYCATFNGISYKYTTKFENGTWHAIIPPLTYQHLETLYGRDNLKPYHGSSFVGGGS